jgi:hypothetical protein
LISHPVFTNLYNNEAHKQERDVRLSFEHDIGLALSQASDYGEAIILGKAAKILREKMLDHHSTFNGTFREGCIEDVIRGHLFPVCELRGQVFLPDVFLSVWLS